jgi:hypothetical protein
MSATAGTSTIAITAGMKAVLGAGTAAAAAADCSIMATFAWSFST